MKCNLNPLQYVFAYWFSHSANYQMDFIPGTVLGSGYITRNKVETTQVYMSSVNICTYVWLLIYAMKKRNRETERERERGGSSRELKTTYCKINSSED